MTGERASELRVARWIDEQGNDRPPLRLAHLGTGFKLIFCFQSWCPGCHSEGFPTLKKLVEALSSHGWRFAAVQTVFEGAGENTFDKLREAQVRYELAIPFGHDTPQIDEPLPTLMRDYRTGGTPWFIVIEPGGTVAFENFSLDTGRLFAAIES